MKLTRTAAAVVAGTAALLLMPTPGQAALGTWNITGPGGISGFTASRLAFGAAKCNPNDAAVKATQGTDGVAIHVGGYRNRTLFFTWSTGAPANSGAISGAFLRGDCGTASVTNIPASATPGGWSMVIPGNADWLVVETNGAVLVTLTLHAVA